MSTPTHLFQCGGAIVVVSGPIGDEQRRLLVNSMCLGAKSLLTAAYCALGGKIYTVRQCDAQSRIGGADVQPDPEFLLYACYSDPSDPFTLHPCGCGCASVIRRDTYGHETHTLIRECVGCRRPRTP